MQKDFDNINEIIINNGVKSKEMTGNKKANNISLNKQESISQVN